jgi:hypothetical protein
MRGQCAQSVKIARGAEFAVQAIPASNNHRAPNLGRLDMSPSFRCASLASSWIREKSVILRRMSDDEARLVELMVAY